MAAAKDIQSWQIKKMWAISKSLGMSKDDLYAMVGAETLHSLSTKKAEEVIGRLLQLQGGHTAPMPSKRQHGEVAGMATEGQQKKVWALMYELAKYDKEPSTATLGTRLCGIIKKDLKLNSTPEKPFAWLNQGMANKLIEVLKKYVTHASGKGGEKP